MIEKPPYKFRLGDFTPLIGNIRYAERNPSTPDEPNNVSLRKTGLVLYHSMIPAVVIAVGVAGLVALLSK